MLFSRSRKVLFERLYANVERAGGASMKHMLGGVFPTCFKKKETRSLAIDMVSLYLQFKSLVSRVESQ